MFKVFKTLFNFREQKKQLLLIVLFSFLISFLIARWYSVVIGGSIFIRGYHIHHFYFGMLCLTVGGLIGILTESQKFSRAAAGFIGVGIGLFADEIGLLLNCTSPARICAYAFPDSFDIISTIAVIIVLILVLVDYLERPDDR